MSSEMGTMHVFLDYHKMTPKKGQIRTRCDLKCKQTHQMHLFRPYTVRNSDTLRSRAFKPNGEDTSTPNNAEMANFFRGELKKSKMGP